MHSYVSCMFVSLKSMTNVCLCQVVYVFFKKSFIQHYYVITNTQPGFGWAWLALTLPRWALALAMPE